MRATTQPADSSAAHPELLPVEIVRRELATRDTATLWLARPGSTAAPAPYLPGQFVTLAFPSASGGVLYRSYSLSSDGDPATPWEITVRRSGAISDYLFGRVRPGALLHATPPRGRFVLPSTLPPAAPLVFVAAGSGIAPIYGLLRALARLPQQRRPRALLHHAAPTPADLIYARELAALDPSGAWLRIHTHLTARGHRLTPDAILAAAGPLAREAHWYVCGPTALKSGIQRALDTVGLPAERFHAEVFGDGHDHTPSRPLVRPPSARVTAHLRLADTGAQLDVRGGETILVALERQGYRPDASCRVGDCGVCRLRLLSGRVDDPGDGLTPDERSAGYVLACVAHPSSDLTLASAGSLAGSGPRSRHASPRAAPLALRVGLAAASVGLFAGALHLTSQDVPTSAAVPSPGDTSGGALPSGPSGISTSGIHIAAPHTSTGVS